MVETVSFIALGLCLLIGLLVIPIGLPGTWIISAGALIFGLLDKWKHFDWKLILFLLILCVIGEAIEQVISVRGAARYGASRAGAWGAFIGGIVGAFIGVPVFLVGSAIGAFLGAFAGAVIGETIARKAMREALTAGYGALLGRVFATAFKLGLGFSMVAMTLIALWK